MEKVRVGIIGAGIGQAHASGFAGVPGVEIAAMAELDEARARGVMNQYKIGNYYKDYKEMLKTGNLDAVSVGVPNFLHKQVVVDALNAGVHVICEKPMAMNAKEAEEMIAAAKRKKKILMIGFTNRYSAASKLLKKISSSGQLGNIYHGHAYCIRRRGIPGLGGWFTTKARSGGGGLIDIGVHIIDLTMWEMGFPDPVAVSGQTFMKFGHKKDYTYVGMWGKKVEGGTFDVDDYASGLVRFKNGSTLSFEVSWAANTDQEGFNTTILGDKAGARLDPFNKPALKIFKEDFGKIVDVEPKFADENGWVNEMTHFVDCIRTGKKPLSPGEHGLAVQKVLDGIYKSSKLGREIRIK